MMQPRHRLARLRALNPSGLHKLMGSAIQQLSGQLTFSRNSSSPPDDGGLCRRT